MSPARKRKHRANTTEIAPAGTALWPADFAPPRQTLLVAACLLGWALLLAMFALDNDLIILKRAMMIVAGARMEPLLGLEAMHSADIAAVIFAFAAIACLGYVNVALGLAALLAVRPWLDGFVYEADNVYFLWATMFLLVLWAVRQWTNPRPIRGRAPLALLLTFWCFSAIATATAIQFDTSLRELLLWAGYATVFFLAINATPSPASKNVVLLGFFAGMAGQALYAYPYLAYILPWMRDYMAEDPRRLAAYFPGLTEFTPEVARRMNLNRASASMVFPNALAALLILGIPGCLACAMAGARTMRRPNENFPRIIRFRYLVSWVLPLFSIIALALFFLGQLALNYRLDGTPWFHNQSNLVLLCVASAASVSAVFLLAGRKWGLALAAAGLATCAAALLLPLMLGALWITYSRGAMLALAMAAVITPICFPGGPWDRLARHLPARLARRRGASVAAAPAIVLLCASVALFAAWHPESAARDTAAPATEVTGEGIDVGVADSANPASFRLRLGYWRVALAIASDNMLTGVGPGNFKYAYPAYQYLGAGEVQNAHNGVLQAWCETGIPGALALVAFWLYTLVAGARILRRDTARGRPWVRWGLLAGVLAFLLHALLDINLSHPSLVTFAMAAAGLLLRSPGGEPSPAAGSRNSRFAVVALLLVAPLISGVAMRPYLLHLGTNGGKFINVDDRAMLDARLRTATFFLAEGTGWARRGKSAPPPVIPIRDVVSLHADRSAIFEFGHVFAPGTDGEMALLAPDAPIPPSAVLQLGRPWHAHALTFESVTRWLRELERMDARFPHVPENAMLLSRTYKLLVEQTLEDQAERKQALLDLMLHWAKEAVRRSPHHKDMHQNLAWSEWLYGTHATGKAALDHFEAGLEAFARSRELSPNEPDFYFAHAHALDAMGRAYTNAGSPDKGENYAQQARSVDAEGRRIQRARWQLGLN